MLDLINIGRKINRGCGWTYYLATSIDDRVIPFEFQHLSVEELF
jgi:hypothetical protein